MLPPSTLLLYRTKPNRHFKSSPAVSMTTIVCSLLYERAGAVMREVVLAVVTVQVWLAPPRYTICRTINNDVYFILVVSSTPRKRRNLDRMFICSRFTYCFLIQRKPPASYRTGGYSLDILIVIVFFMFVKHRVNKNSSDKSVEIN